MFGAGYNPVNTLSPKGKRLVQMVRGLYHLRKFSGAKQWEHVWPEHHEDPRYMKFREQLYFGYKYYYKAITNADKDSGLENFFRNDAVKPIDVSSFHPEKKITVSAGGDLMPYEWLNEKTCRDLWKKTGSFFFDADIVTANLETPIDVNKKPGFVPEVMLKNMYFNGNEELFDIFSGFGEYGKYDVLSFANNHSWDQGEQGLKNTLDFLKKKEIAYTGAALSKEERHHFPVIDKNGIKTAFLSYTFSLNVNTLPAGKEYHCNHIQLNQENPDLSLIIEQTRIARERGADIIIASLHMGCAYQPYPSGRIVQNIRKICSETGIDVVLGGHPHNVQPFEFYECKDPFTGKIKNTFIAYSLGDFVAYDIFKWCRLPLMLKMEFGKSGNEARLINIQARLCHMQGAIENKKLKSLQFVPYTELRNDLSALENNLYAKNEFTELNHFAERFLLPGNMEHFLY
jgi:hypothetical protein